MYQKARPVPYALRELMEKEIDRLESSGVLYRVDNSEWTSPTVNVPKLKNGKMSVRICGCLTPPLKMTNTPFLWHRICLPSWQNWENTEGVLNLGLEWCIQPTWGWWEIITTLRPQHAQGTLPNTAPSVRCQNCAARLQDDYGQHSSWTGKKFHRRYSGDGKHWMGSSEDTGRSVAEVG